MTTLYIEPEVLEPRSSRLLSVQALLNVTKGSASTRRAWASVASSTMQTASSRSSSGAADEEDDRVHQKATQSVRSRATTQPRRTTTRTSAYPSDAGFGPRSSVRWSFSRKQTMLDRIEDVVDDVISSMLSTASTSRVFWRPVARKQGVSYFLDDRVMAPQQRCCCVGICDAPIEDLVDLFVAHDEETLEHNLHIPFDNLMEAKVLAILQHPSNDQPYRSTYVHHAAFSMGAVMHNRDVSVISSTNMFTHSDGSRIGYCLWNSVVLPECPDYYGSKALVRSWMFRSGFVFRQPQDDPDAPTQVFYIVGQENGGMAPRLTSRLLLDRHGSAIGNLTQYFRRKQLDVSSFKPREHWDNKRVVKTCSCCHRPFRMLSMRLHCASCGHVVCRHCGRREQVNILASTVVMRHFCVLCLDKSGLVGPRKSTRVDMDPLASVRTRTTTADAAETRRTQTWIDVLSSDSLFH